MFCSSVDTVALLGCAVSMLYDNPDFSLTSDLQLYLDGVTQSGDAGACGCLRVMRGLHGSGVMPLAAKIEQPNSSSQKT